MTQSESRCAITLTGDPRRYRALPACFVLLTVQSPPSATALGCGHLIALLIRAALRRQAHGYIDRNRNCSGSSFQL